MEIFSTLLAICAENSPLAFVNASQIVGNAIVVDKFVQANINGFRKVRIIGLCDENTGDRWIPFTKKPIVIVMYNNCVVMSQRHLGRLLRTLGSDGIRQS